MNDEDWIRAGRIGKVALDVETTSEFAARVAADPRYDPRPDDAPPRWRGQDFPLDKPEEPIIEITQLREQLEAMRLDRDRWREATRALWKIVEAER